MTKSVLQSVSARTVLALAVLAACGAVHAEPEDARGSVTFGLAAANGDGADRALFNQYRALPANGGMGVLDLSYFRRNPDDGGTVRLEGLNLLGETRSLDFRWARQGEWKLSVDYQEGVRHDPNTLNTGLLGVGTATPQVQPIATGAGQDVHLKLHRTSLGLTLSRVINPEWQFDVSLKGEKKEGARLFGIGMNCPSAVAPGCGGTTGIATGSAVVLLPEPIDANHTQLEARLSYGGEKLHVSAGYYASFYSNNYGSLRPAISSSLNNPVGSLLPVSPGLQGILGQPLALAPDNQAQQLDVSGSYSFSPTTQGHFKVAYSQAVQDQNFAGAGLTGAPTGVSNLGGRVDTTLVQLGLSSRPLPKLALSAKLRYEDTDDKTPLALYNVEGDAANNYTNRRLPLTRTRANLLASYQLSADYRGSLGADFETIDRGVFTASSAAAGISALRQKTDETTVKAELRHTLTETFSGAVSVSSSRRDGSNWLKDNSGRGVTEVADPADPSLGFNANAIFMPTLANRERDKLRVRADWQPSADLSIQFAAEDGADRYRTPSQQGLRSSGMNLFSLDWDYALTDNWHVNGYASTGGQRLHQSRPEGYVMSFGNLSNQAGLGITGKASSKIEVGGTFAFVNDRSRYEQALDPNASANSVALLAAAGGLPDIVFRQTTLNLFSKVTLDKKTSLRFDVIHHRSVWNDWAWNNNGTPFVYADGSTVNSQPKQVTTFLGVSYIYRWL